MLKINSKTIDLAGMKKLEYFPSFDFNELTSLDLSELENLARFALFSYNQLTTLDVTRFEKLRSLMAAVSNKLTFLFIKILKFLMIMPYDFSNNTPTLNYICCNEERISQL